MSKVDVFVCHSLPLVEFLTKKKKLRYIVVGLNPRTKSKFWAFVQDDSLSKALKEWNEVKKIANN